MGYTPPWLYVNKITGGYSMIAPSTTSTDDLQIHPNTADTYPYIELLGNAGIKLFITSGSPLAIYRNANSALELTYDSGNTQFKIESKTDAYDLLLGTTGTGVVKFGTYTAGAASDSTGYITIKDAAGNTRKLMVQA